MKAALLSVMLATCMFAQRGPGPGNGAAHAAAGRGFNRGGLAHAPARRTGRPPYSPFLNPYGFGWYPGYPLYYEDFDYPPEPILPEPPPPSPPVIVQAPSAPAQPVIREYGPPPASEVPAEQQPAFAIVIKDGSMRSAAAVTVQDNVIHYVDPDGVHVRLPLDAVDRAATHRANRERNLDLQLPAPNK